ncbi:hypothetical protein G9A89_023209 [Geosiphon pyriformis]|nr:hypothetical protein G9A89_023209 [Geosiphon pyriformis]
MRGKTQHTVKPITTSGSKRQNSVYRDVNFHDYINNNPDILLNGIGEYRYVRTLGVGKFSQVNLAAHVLTGEQVAIKIIDKTAYDQRIFKRLYREAFLLEKLNHPNIIRLYEVIETKYTVFLIMEYVDGYNLETFLDCQKQGYMDEDQARNIFIQLLEAVKFCHMNHIVHRDLKPPNVLITKQGKVKLADFGLANVYSEDSRLMTLCGSMLYYSPEIVCGSRYKGPEVDTWCLGVVLYRMVTGRDPFKACTVGELKKQICSGRYRIPKHLSCHLQSILRKLLNVDSLERSSLDIINNDPWLYPSGTSHPPSSMPKYMSLKSFRTVKRTVYCDARKSARNSGIPDLINDACHNMELNLFHLNHHLKFGFSILRQLRSHEFSCYYTICRPTMVSEILAIVASVCQLNGISYTYKDSKTLQCVYRRIMQKDENLIEKTSLFEVSTHDSNLKLQLGKLSFAKQSGSLKAYKRACEMIVKSMSIAGKNMA